MDHSHFKKVKLRIHGMHCASCEVLIERKLKNVPGILKIHVSHAKGSAEIISSGEPDIRKLNDLISRDGYHVSSWHDKNIPPQAVIHKNTKKDYLQMGWIFFAIAALYYILKQFDFLPDISVSERMSYGLVFLIGLFAAVSSCIVVVGAMVGAVGSVLSLSPRTNGYLMLFVSVVMLMLGFQLLHLFPGLRKFAPKTPKFISHKIHDLSAKDSRSAPFVLGSLTFFLPCGFTQALQLYVLASGDWKIGALTMLVFSLGTMPALLSLGAVSSFAKGAFQKHFLRFAGVLLVLLSLFNINNGLTLAGYNFNFASAFTARSNNAGQPGTPSVQIVNGKQIVKMMVNDYTYTPNRFTVVEGVPVEWQIDGDNAAGCGRVIVVPSLGISKFLSTGITTITFTPEKTGEIPFNCSMGMMTRGSGFSVISNTTGIVGAKNEVLQGQAAACDPSIASCPKTQKLFIEVSRERGI